MNIRMVVWNIFASTSLVALFYFSNSISAHSFGSEMRYLGNEGVMVTDGQEKILFDPFFHNDFGFYTLVPKDIRQAIFSGTAPYDNISAVFISHAHADHFSAEDVVTFLKRNPKTNLFAPKQAVEQILALANSQTTKSQLTAIHLKYSDKAINILVGNIQVEAVRIPHAGWPGRAELENIVFRVSLNKTVTVMHLGDADPSDKHFLPHQQFWLNKRTDYAFPPYWFMESKEGVSILENQLNAANHVGIHVPTKVPDSLKKTGRDYFSIPAETRILEVKHAH